ncbi:FAD-dependent monooxygenase [Nocardia fluminea]|uniref:FAD-dependent monooxygenase n=1 Tax=Nocardia fluminea TaxID=134984 RepID=UPI003409A0C7
MNKNRDIRVAVIGAGLAGLTTAAALRHFGIDAEVYEAAADKRATGAALGVGSNATKVLRELGIDLASAGVGQITDRFELRTQGGELIRRVPMASMTEELGAPLVTIRRSDLADLLHGFLGDRKVNYGAKLTGYRRTPEGVAAEFGDGSVVVADILVGADGIHSSVRREIAGHDEPVNHGYVCWLATIPFTHAKLPPGYAGHYWGRGKRFGLMDLGNGSAYWWATKNVSDDYRSARDSVKDDVLASFGDWADEVVAAIEATPAADIMAVPAWDRPFLENWGNGPVTLVGDAAHPMLASLAQGGGSSIEDGYVLASALASHNNGEEALRAYEESRRERTRMLVETSRQVSKIEQIESPVLCALRNRVLRYMPDSVVRKQNMAPMIFNFPVWN